MKKAFNFRTLLACALILVMCLTAFVACDKDKDQEQPYDANGINMAVKALKANVRGSSVNADFTLDNHQMFAGVSYPVSWAITANDGEASDVTLTVDGDKTTVHVNGKTKKDVAFTLTATVSDAKGLTATAEFKYSIPAYKLLTHAEYIATKAGEAVTVQGIVSHYGSKSNGAQYNNLFMYDQDGGYYIYTIANSVDPANIQGLHLGAKVEVTGKKDIYNGTHEVKDATIKVIDSSTQAVFEDITDVFKSASSVSDESLAAYEYRLVTIKNVEIGGIDDSEKHNYYFFKSGSLETYIRLSTSECMLNAEQQAAFKAAFAADKGKLATVKGCVVLYNGQLYLNPVDTTPYTVVNTEGLTAQEQVDFAAGNNYAPRTVSGSGTSITLPTEDSIYNNVKISWTADNTDIVKVEGNKATFTFAKEGTVKLTATFTHSEDASANAKKEFTVNLILGTPATVAELYAASKGSTVYVVTGYVVAANGDHNNEGSFVLADETGSIFSYVPAKVEVGDYVRVVGTRDEQFKLAQLKTISVEQLADGKFVEAQPEDINVADVKTDGSTLYTNKYYRIVGGTLKLETKDGKTYYNVMFGDSKKVSLYANAELTAQIKALDGKVVVVQGYSRGVNTTNNYWQFQVTKIEEAQMTDREKVDSVKATLKDMTVNKNFELPTSDITTITWAIKGETTAATLAGNKVTINQTDAEQTVVFVATIVSGDVTDTKDITVTIKAKTTVQVGMKGEPNVAYKFVIAQETLSKDLFLTGEMAGYYFATSENVDDAIDVYVEVVGEDTYRLYTQKGTTKQYIEIIKNGNYKNVRFNDTATESIVWTWDAAKETYTTVVDGKTYALGTFGENKTFSACDITKSSFYAKLYKEVVVVEKTDAEKVAEIKAGLELATTTTATDFNLPTTDVEGATITWASNHTEIIAFEGNVAKVTAPAAETAVTLTATITVGEATDTKDFNVTITVTIPEYDVTVGTLENGTLTVTVDGEAFTGGKLQQGKVLVIAVDVTAGYEIVEVKVNDTALTVGTDGKYTYTVNDAPVEITATAREIKYATVTVGTVDNGTLDVKVDDVAVEADKQYRDGTVLTITATANPGYKLVAVKVNGEAITGNTYTIKETDTTVAITAEFALEYPVMTIAEFKNATEGTKGQVSGIVTVVDIKAVHIQDAAGNALYIYYGKNNVPADTFVAGKEYTFKGTKAFYDGLDQMASPVLVGEGRDTETVINPTVLDEEAYKKLTLKDSALLVTINGVKYTGGKWMLGETEIAHWEGSAAAANSAALNARVALLKEGVEFDLVGVNIAVNKKVLQVTLNSADQVVIDWQPVATVDLKEIGVNGTAKITVVADPAVTTDVKATFVTENDQIATVDANGVITGVAPGTVAINVTANGHTVQVEVTVKETVDEYTVNYIKTVDGANGSIASVMAGETAVEPGTKVVKGTKVTVTVAPAEGYQLASYTLNGGEAVAAKGQTSFDVTVTEDVTIVVTFEVKPAEPVVKTLNFTSTDTNTSKSDTQQVWEENGITLTNDKDKSSNNVVVAAPVRLYQSSKVTISCTGITKIVFVTDSQTKYVTALKDSISSLGTVTVNGYEVTLELSSAKDSIEFSCTKQVRLKTLSVYTMA